MTPDETLNQAVWWVLKELYKEKLALSSPDEVVHLVYQNPKGKNLTPSLDDQRRAIEVLGNNKAINIIGNFYDNPVVTDSMALSMGFKPDGVKMEILKGFDKVYQEYKKALEPKETENKIKKEEFPQVKRLQREKAKAEEIRRKMIAEQTLRPGGDWSYYRQPILVP